MCLALLCAGTARHVAASDLIVEWTAPPECPDKEKLTSRIEDSLGDAVTRNLTAATRVTRASDSGAYRAVVTITSAAGPRERTLENSSCEILTDSVALVIALIAVSSSPTSSDEGGDSVALAISAHATALAGAMPNLAFGAGGALAVELFGALRLEWSGTYYAKQTATFDRSSIGAEFELLRFGLRGCLLWSFGALELAPCAGADLYRLEGAGFGGSEQKRGEAYLGGPALGGFGRVRLSSWLALTLAADGSVPVSRRRFVYPDRGALLQPSAVLFQVFVAPEVQF